MLDRDTGAPNAPLFTDVAHAPDGGTAHWLTTSDGVRIRVAVWKKDASNGTVLLFPGRTEYVEKYGPAAGEFLSRGFAVMTIDWRGQGIADRLIPQRIIGHVKNFSDYQRDVEAMLKHARALSLPEPFYLVAHSMGGAIGLGALYEGLPVKAAAFSAPMWGIQMKPAMRSVALGLGRITRPLGLSGRMVPGQEWNPYVRKASFRKNALTTDESMWSLMDEQISAHPDLALGGPSLRWLHESLVEVSGLSRKDSPDVPSVTFIGGDETIVDPKPIYSRMSRWANGELIEVPGARHEIMMERPEIRTRFFDTASDLFKANP